MNGSKQHRGNEGHGGHDDHDVPADHDADHDGHQGRGAHDKHEGHSVEMFRDRFWLSLLLSVPTLVWSPSLQAWSR